MIELRWKAEPWGNTVGMRLNAGIMRTEKPVLQYRQEEGPKGEQWWGEWRDVPTEYIET